MTYKESPPTQRIAIMEGDHVSRVIPLPAYGEVHIITHGGRVSFVHTTVKEKVE